jgi:hypothetical protein
MIEFNNLSHSDMNLIEKVADRVANYYQQHDLGYDRLSLTMDISAAHLNTPLDLEAMLAGDDADFFHDAFGIRNHINRETGELEDCFVPRFAVSQ